MAEESLVFPRHVETIKLANLIESETEGLKFWEQTEHAALSHIILIPSVKNQSTEEDRISALKSTLVAYLTTYFFSSKRA